MLMLVGLSGWRNRAEHYARSPVHATPIWPPFGQSRRPCR